MTRNGQAVADGHVTVIRVDPKQVNPYYLADYLRVGAGAIQIEPDILQINAD
jgi:type I restriction enzyme M protein